jgi:hypothetical protein
MQVHQLTSEEAQSLVGVQFMPDNYFNPIMDADGNHVISIEEVEQCSIDWVKALPLINYKPIIIESWQE